MTRVCDVEESEHYDFVCPKGYGKRSKSELVMLRAIDDAGCTSCMRQQGKKYEHEVGGYELDMLASRYEGDNLRV